MVFWWRSRKVIDGLFYISPRSVIIGGKINASWIKRMPDNMPTKPCLGLAAYLYRERFDLPRHHGMSVLTFSGSRGSEGTFGKQQSNHTDPLWYTTQGMLLIPQVLIPCFIRTAIITQHKKEQMTWCQAIILIRQRTGANCNEFRINPKITIFIKEHLFKMPLTICRPYHLSLNAQIQLNSPRRTQNIWHFADEIWLKFIVGCSVDSKPSPVK